jgi:hypothetical protein
VKSFSFLLAGRSQLTRQEYSIKYYKVLLLVNYVVDKKNLKNCTHLRGKIRSQTSKKEQNWDLRVSSRHTLQPAQTSCAASNVRGKPSLASPWTLRGPIKQKGQKCRETTGILAHSTLAKMIKCEWN